MDYMDLAAGMQGMSQGMMSNRARQKFNAGAGGYGDLYQRYNQSNALKDRVNVKHNLDMGSDPDQTYADLKSRQRGKGGSFGGGFMKGLSIGNSAMGGGGTTGGAVNTPGGF